MIRAGALDQPITLERVTVTQDDFGAPLMTWTTIANSPGWAEYLALRGSEMIEAQKRTSRSVYKLRIRRFSGLTPADRVTVAGQVADIINIEDGQRADDMVLWCEVKE